MQLLMFLLHLEVHINHATHSADKMIAALCIVPLSLMLICACVSPLIRGSNWHAPLGRTAACADAIAIDVVVVDMLVLRFAVDIVSK